MLRYWIDDHIFLIFPKILPFDREQAYLCGDLETVRRLKGLSLGDRACLAAESRWTEINWKAHRYDVKIQLIRQRQDGRPPG